MKFIGYPTILEAHLGIEGMTYSDISTEEAMLLMARMCPAEFENWPKVLVLESNDQAHKAWHWDNAERWSPLGPDVIEFLNKNRSKT